MKPVFEDTDSHLDTISEGTNDVQYLKEIIIAKEMEICALKREILQLKKKKNRNNATTVVNGSKPSGKSPSHKTIEHTEPIHYIRHRPERQYRIFSIGEYGTTQVFAQTPNTPNSSKGSFRQ